MVYSIYSTSYVNKGKMIDKTQINSFEGFLMSSKKKSFRVCNTEVKDLYLLHKSLIHPIVSQKVLKKYELLVQKLAELLIEDDDGGESCREALNQIEKFRLEIKNKYRNFLQKKELEFMAKKLSVMQKEAAIRLIEIRNAYYEFQNVDRRSK